MQAIDWSDFQAFLAVARTGQLARAGRVTGMNATTIGRRVRRLEKRLSTILFEQVREGQILTQAGERLLQAVEQMALASGDIETGNAETGPTGSLRISVSEGFGSWIVARHLGAFAARYPGLTIDLVASTGFLSPSRREADIAVLLSRPKAGPIIASKLSDYTLRLYASPAYLAQRPPIHEPKDLAKGHLLIGYVPELIYAPELDYLSEIGPDLAPTLRSSSILAQHHLLSTDAGVGVLPCFIGDVDPGLRRVLPQHSIQRSFWLVTHKDTHSFQRIRMATRWLTDLAANSADVLMPKD